MAAPSLPSALYRPSLTLLTDLYELTMAYGYWKTGMAETEACFHHVFREHPFGGGFTIACGLGYLVDYVEALRFEPGDLGYLAEQRGADGAPLFAADFLDYLAALRFRCDVDAVPEGTVVFPYEPLVRVTGPIIEAQLVETALLNLINFQSLVVRRPRHRGWLPRGRAAPGRCRARPRRAACRRRRNPHERGGRLAS